jgi:2-oxoglutarate dehydrogenase E1 component
MTTMNQLFDSTMYFGGNAPFVEELYENYLNDPTSVPAEWREYFDRLAQMPGYVARDVAHAPVIAAFAELAKDGGFRRPRGLVGHRAQEAVGGWPAGHRLPFARHPLGRPRSAEAPAASADRRTRAVLLWLHRCRPEPDLQRRFAEGLPETAQLGQILER